MPAVLRLLQRLHDHAAALDRFAFEEIEIRAKRIGAKHAEDERRAAIDEGRLGPFGVDGEVVEQPDLDLIRRQRRGRLGGRRRKQDGGERQNHADQPSWWMKALEPHDELRRH